MCRVFINKNKQETMGKKTRRKEDKKPRREEKTKKKTLPSCNHELFKLSE